jgi:hypothetical protein
MSRNSTPALDTATGATAELDRSPECPTCFQKSAKRDGDCLKTYATRYNRLFGITALALAVLAGMTSAAQARNAYPPGWNVEKNVPESYSDFIPGKKQDWKRYWPEQTRPGDDRSRAMTYPPLIYQLTPGSNLYHAIR